jgi:hypothetical protein
MLCVTYRQNKFRELVLAAINKETGSVERRLQDILAYPREDLGTELKSWLDLSNESNTANLAQAMLALANYGGIKS